MGVVVKLRLLQHPGVMVAIGRGQHHRIDPRRAGDQGGGHGKLALQLHVAGLAQPDMRVTMSAEVPAVVGQAAQVVPGDAGWPDSDRLGVGKERAGNVAAEEFRHVRVEETGLGRIDGEGDDAHPGLGPCGLAKGQRQRQNQSAPHRHGRTGKGAGDRGVWGTTSSASRAVINRITP